MGQAGGLAGSCLGPALAERLLDSPVAFWPSRRGKAQSSVVGGGVIRSGSQRAFLFPCCCAWFLPVGGGCVSCDSRLLAVSPSAVAWAFTWFLAMGVGPGREHLCPVPGRGTYCLGG